MYPVRLADFVRIERAGDLIYWTYFMVDWSKVEQEPSDVKCSECGETMMRGEPALDPKGRRYECYVCHKDKKLYWVRGS